jgi:ATP/maltotriose-dependent transcriptional regulator MalT
MRKALPHVDDPRARTAATYQGASALALRADYSEAKELLALFSDDAERFDLEFTMPFLNWVKSQIALGQRRFAEAERALQAIEDAAAKAHDRHHEVNARILRARLLLQNGDPKGALDCVRVDPLVPLSPSWRAEYLATRAMALSCAGRSAQALASADHAARLTAAPEVHLFIQTARAIATVKVNPTETRRLVAMAQHSAMWDAVVCGARSSVDLADSLASDVDLRPVMAQLYRRTNDTALARRAGLRTRTTSEPTEVLSPRELEVLNLIALGYRNRNISQALFIADSTTKVHIRHIFEKLGVRTRSEAVARLQMFTG